MLRLAAFIASQPEAPSGPRPSAPSGINTDNIQGLLLSAIVIVLLIAVLMGTLRQAKQGDVKSAANVFITVLVIGITVAAVIGGVIWIAPDSFLDFVFNPGG